MELRRRLRKNEINNNIRDSTTFITRSEKTIKRLKSSNMGEEYVKAQIVKLTNAIQEKETLLVQLNKDLLKISSGGLDEEINQEYEKAAKKMNIKQKESDEIKAAKKEEKYEKKTVFKEYWNGIISASRNYRQKERDMRYAYKYFYKVIDSLPSYMQKNLSEMSNNKGYIWRGVCFYGDLPEQPGPRVMFEKKRGGILVIHEYTDREYRRYEKQGKNRKQLVHKENRRVKCMGSSLVDYIKK